MEVEVEVEIGMEMGDWHGLGAGYEARGEEMTKQALVQGVGE